MSIPGIGEPVHGVKDLDAVQPGRLGEFHDP